MTNLILHKAILENPRAVFVKRTIIFNLYIPLTDENFEKRGDMVELVSDQTNFTITLTPSNVEMPPVVFPDACLENPVAHFCKDAIGLTIKADLTTETLELRAPLERLALSADRCDVFIKPRQLGLFDDAPKTEKQKEKELAAAHGGKTLNSDEFAAAFEHAGKEIIEQRGDVDVPDLTQRSIEHAKKRVVNTATGEIVGITGAHVLDAMMENFEQAASTPVPQSKRQAKRGNVTVEYRGKSVTMTDAQFSNATQKAKRQVQFVDQKQLKRERKPRK